MKTIRNTFFRCKLIYAGKRERKQRATGDVESHIAPICVILFRKVKASGGRGK
jgi:hypothetical protein